MTLAFAALTLLMLALVALDTRRVDRRRQQALEATMSGLVTDRGRATLDEIGALVADHKHVLGRYHARSREFREAGSLKEAVEWMRNGCEAIEKLAPDFITALATLRKLARTVSVIVALPPMRPYAFRAWELRGMAGVGGVLHHLLMTGQQRLRLRLQILAHAFGMALRWLRRSTDRVTRRPEGQAAWARIDALVSDLATAGDETLLTAARIVQALDAVEFGKPQDGEAAAPRTVGSA